MNEELDQKIVRRLRKSGEQQGGLLPVVKDQYGNIISGRHRKCANPQWRETTIEVKDELDRLVKIIHFNVQHRPSQKETAERLLGVAENLEAKGVPIAEVLPQIVNLVPYSERWVRQLLPDKYKHGEMKREGFEPQIYNVWSFGKFDTRFGTADFEGRTPGQITQNTLYYFTNEGDLVVDPMAGGGTTIDVCKLMKRECKAYDINPVREDIKKNDITKGLPSECKDCDLIFLDPPYFNMVFDEFKDVDDFYTFIKTLSRVTFDTVKEKGSVALIMQDMTEKANHCLSGESYRIFRDIGFETMAHISCPLTTQQWIGRDVNWAKQNKILLGRNRDLYVFRKNQNGD